MKLQGNLSSNILDNHQIYFVSLYVNRLFPLRSIPHAYCYYILSGLLHHWLVGLLRRSLSILTNHK